MITITLNMSESLLSILRDAGRPGQPTSRIRVHPGPAVAGRRPNTLSSRTASRTI